MEFRDVGKWKTQDIPDGFSIIGLYVNTEAHCLSSLGFKIWNFMLPG